MEQMAVWLYNKGGINIETWDAENLGKKTDIMEAFNCILGS